MGLNLIALKKPIGIVEYNVEENCDDEFEDFGPDERLLEIMMEIGTELEDPFITFAEEQFIRLIKVSESIDDGTIKTEKEYAKRYSNETMLEFYQRWDRIINNLKNMRYQVNWREEHVVIYISC